MIVLTGVSKWYGVHAAVRDLNETIERGEHLGLVGLNGAGKTTTLRMLAGLLRPTTGRILLNGHDSQTPAGRASVGFLPDRPPLYDDMRVEAFLAFAGRLRGMQSDALAQRLSEVVERCALSDVRDAPIGTLSHGYRQRVGIAQALVHAPKVLILDEPISGLDPLQIVEVRDLLRSLRGEHTVVLSSHNLGELTQTCDRLLVLHEGRLAAEGTPDDLARHVGAPSEVVLRARADASAFEQMLRELPGVDEVRVRSVGEEVEATVQGEGDLRPSLARAVVEAGWELLLLETQQSELEQALQRLREGP